MSGWMTESQLHTLISQLDSQTKEEGGFDEGTGKVNAWLQVVDGSISLVPSGHDGKEPVIEAEYPLKLFVNGSHVCGEISVKLEDKIGWGVESRPLFEIDVSPDKMSAWFTLHAKERFEYKVYDRGQTSHLVLAGEEVKNSVIETVRFTDVLVELANMAIPVYDSEAIQRELQNPTFQPVLIARGKEPVAGEDASLTLYFKENIESSFEETNGSIDYRNHLKIPSVKKGDLIAQKKPMKKGEPGCDVFGTPMNPANPKDIIIIGKQHVFLSTNHEAYATREGRPRITGGRIKLIDITTEHIIPGDVDMSTGNIVFSGDITVYGDITDGMIVEALGDIYVIGNVYRATVTATGSVYIKGNTVGSKIYSGHYGVLFNRLYAHSNELNEKFKALRNSARQLLQIATSKHQAVAENQLYQLLLETKYKDIPTIVNEVLVCIANIQSIRSDQLVELKNKLQNFHQPSSLHKTDLKEYVFQLQPLLIEAIESIRRCEEQEVCTDIQQCHLTKIMSNGDILIQKQGVLQSKLYSRRNIIFFERDSVCRGSELEAGGVISAMVVGGVSGGGTVLKAEGRIEVSLIYEGRVIVKNFAKEIMTPMENVRFYVSGSQLIVQQNPEQEGESERDIG